MDIEQLKKEYKVLSLVDWRDPTANNGCPLFHTKVVKAEDAHEVLLKDFKAEMEHFGLSGDIDTDDCGEAIEVDGEETFYWNGEDISWISCISKMTLAEIEERVGHKPTTYSIRNVDYDRISHTLTDLT